MSGHSDFACTWFAWPPNSFLTTHSTMLGLCRQITKVAEVACIPSMMFWTSEDFLKEKNELLCTTENY